VRDWVDLAQALDRVEFGIAVLDGGVIRLANQAAANLVGVPLEGVVGHHVAEFVTPTDDLLRDIEDLETGRFQGFRARRSVNAPGGGRTLFWVTMRTVEISDERLEVAIFVPEVQLGQLGRHPIRAWMDVIPVCLGIADRHLRIRSISAEVYELLGRLPSECVGTQLLDWVDPAQRTELSAATANAVAPGIFPDIGMAAADGASASVCVMLAPTCSQEHDLIYFALVGRLEDFIPPSGDRVNDLEMRLRRIAAEVRAAGVMDSLSGLPRAATGQELTDLTARQWEILARMAQGQRVSTIANELYISPSTVRNHLAVIFKKFGVHNQAELVVKLLGNPPA
jgi:DNA-binding CsgD family transcriptional regulator